MVILFDICFRNTDPSNKHPIVQKVKSLKEIIQQKYGNQISTQNDNRKTLKKVVYFRIHSNQKVTLRKIAKLETKITPDDLIENLHQIAYSEYSQLIKSKFRIFENQNIVIQSKSSCLPVWVLHSVIGSQAQGVLMESCAAPGNNAAAGNRVPVSMPCRRGCPELCGERRIVARQYIQRHLDSTRCWRCRRRPRCCPDHLVRAP